MGYFAEVFRAAWSIIVGLGVTIREFFRPAVTVQYPDRRLEPARGFRGIPVLVADEETGKAKCTACGSCLRACPNGCIEMETVKDERGKRAMAHFRIDMSRCLLCNLCVESCNFDSLVMSEHYELAGYSRAETIFDEDRLLELGRTTRGAGIGGAYGTQIQPQA